MNTFIFAVGCMASFLLGFLFAALFNISSRRDEDDSL